MFGRKGNNIEEISDDLYEFVSKIFSSLVENTRDMSMPMHATETQESTFAPLS